MWCCVVSVLCLIVFLYVCMVVLFFVLVLYLHQILVFVELRFRFDIPYMVEEAVRSSEAE